MQFNQLCISEKSVKFGGSQSPHLQSGVKAQKHPKLSAAPGAASSFTDISHPMSFLPYFSTTSELPDPSEHKLRLLPPSALNTTKTHSRGPSANSEERGKLFEKLVGQVFLLHQLPFLEHGVLRSPKVIVTGEPGALCHIQAWNMLLT